MSKAPLAGVKVLDLSWVMVGPVSGRYFADLGAEVIKVESSSRVDPLRMLGPFREAPNLTNSLSYQFINAGKRSIKVNLQNDEGRRTLLELLKQMDILVQSYTPGVMERLGLDEPTLFEANPNLIYISTSLFGSYGPRAQTSGVGTTGAAYSGAGALVGWDDRPPTGPFHAWTDAVTPRYIVASALAALARVRAGGPGCRIDVSQAEAGLQFVSPSYLEYAVNGRDPVRRGSRLSVTRAPSNVFPCTGKEEWIAIDVTTPAQWSELAELIGAPAQTAQYDTLIGRLREIETLEKAIADWTSGFEVTELESMLQRHAIPAHAVTKGRNMLADADLLADDYYAPQHDGAIGDFFIRRPQWEISPANPVMPRPAEPAGESTAEVLSEYLGYDDAEVDRLRAAGALT